MDEKPFWQSKELIVAMVSLATVGLQSKFGWVIDPATQGYITVIAMAVLRAFFTKSNVTLK
jgi:hypothetical protein